jgi:predicted Zn-dependent protease
VAKPPVAPAVSRDLIDRFIEQESPAPAKKAAFFTPQQAAKRSLDDTAGLVTETLARIYEKQGNLPKAIDAYRKLAVKYPEKSAYFAALSRSLEEQLNP